MIWVSYCTAVRDRLHHIAATYFHNIHTQANLPVEFVLVNYGDNSGLDDWYYRNKKRLAVVRYVRVTDPVRTWNAPHAKNVAHRWARGHIVCNLDADNIIADGLTEFLIGSLNVQRRAIVALRDTNFCGRMAMKKRDFHWLGGYDERYCLGMAWEDTDLVQRAVDAQFDRITLPDRFYVALNHDEDDKWKGTAAPDNRQALADAHGRLFAYRPLIQANPTGWGQANVQVTEPTDRVDIAH